MVIIFSQIQHCAQGSFHIFPRRSNQDHRHYLFDADDCAVILPFQLRQDILTVCNKKYSSIEIQLGTADKSKLQRYQNQGLLLSKGMLEINIQVVLYDCLDIIQEFHSIQIYLTSIFTSYRITHFVNIFSNGI